MSVSSTEHLARLDTILYRRPAGRNIIGFAIDEIERLRAENTALREDAERYRWFRSRVRPIYRPGYPQIELYIDGQRIGYHDAKDETHTYAESIDAAIDAARKAPPDRSPT